MDRKIAAAYGALVTISTALAAFAIVWFGPDGRVASVAGLAGRFDSAWSLFLAPALLTLVGVIAALSLSSARIYARSDELSAEARRGLEKHRQAERRLLVGFGILVAFEQLLVILSTAGLAVSLEFGVRTIFFLLGTLFAGAGNMIPKIPFAARWWQSDRATYAKFVRFSARVLTLAGITICGLAVFAQAQNIRPFVAVTLGSGFGLITAHALLAALVAARKPV